ncbi:thioesterase domain-containing protein [Bradyrhizobium erythrophlei]|uniref:thioesterase domain-containing protein n=1 Tax=Bradyrhizobium erythrophlei TaxID=1437360 RepID=UPI0035ECE52C
MSSRPEIPDQTIGQIVANAWTGILKTEVAPERWAEAGGDSSGLARCLLEIESATGLELARERFSPDMTIAEMVKVIVSGQAAGEVARPPGEAPPTLFLFSGSLGYGPSMAAFAGALGKVARVVPIKYPDLRSILDGKDSVADMAEAGIAQIQRSQPVGPVRLIGHSLGGAVAFEVAARLLESGRSVNFLGILDTPNIYERQDYHETLARTLRRLRANRVNMSRLACRALAKVTAIVHGEAYLAGMLDRYSRGKFATTRFRIKLELQEVLRARAFFRWLAGAKPRLPIAGTLFRCNRPSLPQPLGWDVTFASLDVIPIVGSHVDLVAEPYLTTNHPLVEAAVVQTYLPTELCGRRMPS